MPPEAARAPTAGVRDLWSRRSGDASPPRSHPANGAVEMTSPRLRGCESRSSAGEKKILGLATARLITREVAGAEVFVLEKEPELAQHQTSHNSGVVHAGLCSHRDP